jgi:hypothetical protein
VFGLLYYPTTEDDAEAAGETAAVRETRETSEMHETAETRETLEAIARTDDHEHVRRRASWAVRNIEPETTDRASTDT